ncbi:MAG: phage head-tail connector protein [Pseudomonadota bacterium]
MILTELEAPASLPIEVRALADHLRLGTGFADDGSEDALLETLIRAATSAVEARIGKALIERRLSWQLTRWQTAGAQGLPVAPVAAIEAVRLIDAEGGAADVPAATWRLEPDAHVPRLVGRSGGALPPVPVDGRVEIVLRAGFGPAPEDVPADLRQAVTMVAAGYYEGRTEVGGALARPMPMGVSALLAPHRLMRV